MVERGSPAAGDGCMIGLDTISDPARPEEDAGGWIVLKTRWVGVILGYIVANAATGAANAPLLNALLAVGLAFTLLDTWFRRRDRIFLGRFPLFISAMEALFIGLLCHFDSGAESAFRYYYFLSVLCCVLRHGAMVGWLTCVGHIASWTVLWLSAPSGSGGGLTGALLVPAVLVWVTWAGLALGRSMREARDELGRLNLALVRSQAELEQRIAERTRQLQETQAQMLQQEKMANFGLLAAGIAHEVGNPLTGVSNVVQLLQRKDHDERTREKLDLMAGELARMRVILRELTEFGRPASRERSVCSLAEVVDDALRVAKYHKRPGSRLRPPKVADDLPRVACVRGQLAQVILNLVLNALDAAGADGIVELRGDAAPEEVSVEIEDSGPGLSASVRDRLFEPFVTTKSEGTGLGLYLSRRIVMEHGGRLELGAGSLGGALFRVVLPAWHGERQERLEAPPRAGAAT